MSQSRGSLASISRRPMTYQTQAIQWARSAKTDMSSVSTTALHWEYRSSFCSSRSSRSSLTVFSRCTSDVCGVGARGEAVSRPPSVPPSPRCPGAREGCLTKRILAVLKVTRKCKGDRMILKLSMGTSLAVQWLGLCASTAGGERSIPGQGTKIPQAMQCGNQYKSSNNTTLIMANSKYYVCVRHWAK